MNVSFDVVFTPIAAQEFDYWKQNDDRVYQKIVRMINYIQTNFPPKMFHPKALTGEFKGYIRLKIDKEHRLVYRVDNNIVKIVKCKDHYRDH